MMVCFEVFYFEFTINLPPPTGGGLVQQKNMKQSGAYRHQIMMGILWPIAQIQRSTRMDA